MIRSDLLFPEGFLWGSATSAFQVEGGCTNHDFYDWAMRGRIKDGTSPDDAVHFWKYYKKDIALMKKMRHTTARIGIEWARIEPDEYRFDYDAIAHYRDILTEMRNAGILPMVTIHHFSNPMWFVKNGGWANRRAVGMFARYAAEAVRRLGDLVYSWITINEPSVYAVSAYLFGEFPPGKKNIITAFNVMNCMADAHCIVYDLIHDIHRQRKWDAPRVGVAKHLRTFDPLRENSKSDRFAAYLMDRYFNEHYLRRINKKKRTLDIFGMNYYSGDLVSFPMKMEGRPELAKNRLGWDMYPEGFYRLLVRYYERYRLPIYITENGTCDDNDELRPHYILDHVAQMHRAIGDGVDIAAYYHWSTMDNFELVDGLMSRFGLVHVDHESPRRARTLKKSGMLYGAICRANGITRRAVKKFAPEWTSPVERHELDR